MAAKPEIKRPWGGYTILKKTKIFWVKKLFINQNARLSLQRHYYRSEVWYVLSGSINAQVGNKTHSAKSGDVLFVPANRKHRITGTNKACVLEFAFGRVLEKDIVRYDDDYGRA